MRRLPKPLILASLVAATFGVAMSADAQARTHGRAVHVHGPDGGGYRTGRIVSRAPGSVEVRRGLVTEGGRGVRETRSTSWGEGVLHNEVRRTYRQGGTVERDTTVTRGEGSLTVDRNRTGVRGNEQSQWTTIYRTDDGYRRERNASTSNGRNYQASRDVSVSDDHVTVERRATTGRGGSVQRTRTYPRPN